MSEEQQRIAIAEACGWCRSTDNSRWVDPKGSNVRFPELPDYLSDLNAMHSAEQTLTTEESKRYDQLLSVRASSQERAKAFLTIKNLWKD